MQRHRLIAALALLAPAGAFAQPSQGLYISLGAGVDVLQDQIVKGNDAAGSTHQDWRFDAGPGAAVSLGYDVGNGLRLELEGDYARNSASGVKLPGGPVVAASGSEQRYGGFINLAYDFHLGLPVVPFIGVGAGYQALTLDNPGGGGGLGTTLSGTGGAFAYQGMAGLSYAVAAIPGLSLTAEYRLIGVLQPPAYDRSQDGPTDTIARSGSAVVSNTFNHEALIGLRYSFGTPPPPAPPPPQAEAAPPAPPATRTYLVFFDWDRADLSARARQIVAEAAAASTHVPVTRIDVNGYTDLSGGADYNQRLSVRRAEAVEAELVRDGVPKAEIVVRGFGENNPLVPTAAGVREPQNRRVEIILH